MKTLDGPVSEIVKAAERERERQARQKRAGQGLVDKIAQGQPIFFNHSSVAEEERLAYARESKRIQNDALSATLTSLDNFMGATVLSLRAIEAQLATQHEFLASITDVVGEIATQLPQPRRKRAAK